jgi:hypothetical protein
MRHTWKGADCHSLPSIFPARVVSTPRTLEATSSHDAVRKAVAFFLDPFWKGPKPTPFGDGTYVTADAFTILKPQLPSGKIPGATIRSDSTDHQTQRRLKCHSAPWSHLQFTAK